MQETRAGIYMNKTKQKENKKVERGIFISNVKSCTLAAHGPGGDARSRAACTGEVGDSGLGA
jgi:hypothetical protein